MYRQIIYAVLLCLNGDVKQSAKKTLRSTVLTFRDARAVFDGRPVTTLSSHKNDETRFISVAARDGYCPPFVDFDKDGLSGGLLQTAKNGFQKCHHASTPLCGPRASVHRGRG